eukprot:TRINITY_DN3843_c0_g1_i4.p1 TRINITY_DN3843_c0_g1~~TRINITY_DN3843_c0_g1_i4.p1  ORF type:complete len:594 (-),score=104.46 TRINITY_DN3843_c0_g1_i4:40-1686(-)
MNATDPTKFDGDLYAMSWRNILYQVDRPRSLFSRCYTKKRKQSKKKVKVILNNVCGHVAPGEVLALMGPSGSGKSTLLDVLSGRVKKGLTGDILINGTKTDHSDIKKNTAYMQQDDRLHPTLTVRETLYFSAMLRLSSDMPKSERLARVDEVIEELGLSRAADTKIGDGVHIRGVSGGERRRVSLGVELITKPSLLLCDEPTSGLDSRSTQFLVELLKSLAKKGKAILCTIHQPSSYVFNLFDKVGILSKGNLVYFGTIPTALDFFGRNGLPLPAATNPADFFIDSVNYDFNDPLDKTTSEGVSKLVEAFKDSDEYNKVINDIEEATKNSESSSAALADTPNYQTSRFSQFWYLTYRLILSWSRNPYVFGSKIAVYFIIGITISTLNLRLPLEQNNIQDRISALSFSSGFLMFNSMASINELVFDREIFLRERMNGYYSVLPYTLANTLVSHGFIAICSVLYTFMVYWIIGFNINALGFSICNLIATLWVAESISAVTSAFVQAPETGMDVVSAFLSIFLLCNGYFLRKENIPGMRRARKEEKRTFLV